MVFCGSIGRARAFELVTTSMVCAAIFGLVAITGVIITDDNAYDNASDFLNWAVESYSEFYTDTLENARSAINGIAQGIYETGCMAVGAINDLMPWLGTFVNDKILPLFGTRDISATPIFNNGVRIHYALPFHDFGSGVGADLSNYGLGFFISDSTTGRFSTLPREQGDYVLIRVGNNGPSPYSSFTLNRVVGGSIINPCSYRDYFLKNGKVDYSSLGTFGNSVLSSTANIYILGTQDVCVMWGSDTYYFHSSSGTWTKDMNGELVLDPDIFNPVDTTGDIDIGDRYEDVYDKTTNSIDNSNKWVIGNDATWSTDGSLVNSGTVDIPLDITNSTDVKDWVNSDSYPIISDKPLDTVTDTDITDTYPDYVPSVPDLDYTADWTTVFPFCIPFDIFKFIALLSASPQAPKFTWNYNLMGVKGSLVIDLKQFDEIAKICRNMMNLLFIVGLAMVTRDKLIKA